MKPEQLVKSARIYVDIETRDLTARYDPSCPVWCVGVIDTSGEAVSLDWCEDTILYLQHEIKKGTYFVFHNHSFDAAALRIRGVDIPQSQIHDTMCMSYVLRPDTSDTHSLSSLAPMVGLKKIEMNDFSQDSPLLRKRNLSDIRITRRLFHFFMHEFMDDEQSWEYYCSIEMPYGKMIQQLQEGISIDIKYVEEYARSIESKVEESLASVHKVIPFIPSEPTVYAKKVFLRNAVQQQGTKFREKPIFTSVYNGTYEHCKLTEFNPNSGDHIYYALRKLYQWKPQVFTANGSPKTDLATLTELSVTMPLCHDILAYKKYSKLLSTFIPPLLEAQGTVRASFNQYTTVTRRLSSSSPNLQNIPARDEEGAAIRRAFVASPGNVLVCGDLDRIEVVVLGWYLEYLFGDRTLSDAIRQNIDVHQINADNWGIPRKVAKNTLFCIIYGGGRDRIAETAKISREAAGDIFLAIQDKLPALLDFRDIVADMAVKNQGLLYDLFGGRIYVPDIMAERQDVYSAAKRKVANYVIQGTAGSIFKILQLDAQEWIEQVNVPLDLRLVVHDEAVYECPASLGDFCESHLTNIYSNDSLLDFEGVKLPIRAQFHHASNWLEAKGE